MNLGPYMQSWRPKSTTLERNTYSRLWPAPRRWPAQGIVDITVFLTGEVEISQVKKLPCASGQFFGRPNWGRIFKQKRKERRDISGGVLPMALRAAKRFAAKDRGPLVRA